MTLPTSIEAHLAEAGFSQTELLILRHSLDGRPQSLRELASKTRKSTGVLDQAMKKLIRRKIMTRERVNDVPKFTLASMDAVMRWIEEDVQKQTENLLRKKEDFQSFVSTLKQDGARPKIEYFQGKEGIAKAYDQLLEGKPVELLQFLPVNCKEEEDPLCEMRTNFNRKRRRVGTILKVIAHDTHLGKRFKDRDEYCYRETKLADSSGVAIPFEKIICGNTVACFNHAEESACFIHFPALAEGEKAGFERIWMEEAKKVDSDNLDKDNDSVISNQKKRIITTVTLFAITSFFLSVIYLHTFSLIKTKAAETLLTSAVASTNIFSESDLEQLHIAADMQTDAYQRVFKELNNIRDANIRIMYAYILRPTELSGMWSFVADADSNYFIPFESDIDSDGIPDESDENVAPGVMVDVSNQLLDKHGLDIPVAEKNVITDQWGSYVTVSAPIKGPTGRVNAVLALDMNVDDVYLEARKRMVPLLLFFILFWLVYLLCLSKQKTFNPISMLARIVDKVDVHRR